MELTLTEQLQYAIEYQYLIETCFMNEAAGDITDAQRLANFTRFVNKWVKVPVTGVSIDTKKSVVVIKAKTEEQANKFKEEFLRSDRAKKDFKVTKITKDGHIHIKSHLVGAD